MIGLGCLGSQAWADAKLQSSEFFFVVKFKFFPLKNKNTFERLSCEHFKFCVACS